MMGCTPMWGRPFLWCWHHLANTTEGSDNACWHFYWHISKISISRKKKCSLAAIKKFVFYPIKTFGESPNLTCRVTTSTSIYVTYIYNFCDICWRVSDIRCENMKEKHWNYLCWCRMGKWLTQNSRKTLHSIAQNQVRLITLTHESLITAISPARWYHCCSADIWLKYF